jgi:hypothetical protein
MVKGKQVHVFLTEDTFRKVEQRAKELGIMNGPTVAHCITNYFEILAGSEEIVKERNSLKVINESLKDQLANANDRIGTLIAEVKELRNMKKGK